MKQIVYLSQGQVFSFKASDAGYTMLVPCCFVLQYLFLAVTPMDYILEWNSILIGCQWPEIPCRYSQLNLTHPLELPLSLFLLLPTVLDGGLPTAYRLYNALQWIVFSWCRVRCVSAASVDHTNNGHSSKFQVLDSSSSVPFSVVSYSSYGCSALCQYCNLFMSRLWWCADYDIIWRELKDLVNWAQIHLTREVKVQSWTNYNVCE